MNGQGTHRMGMGARAWAWVLRRRRNWAMGALLALAITSGAVRDFYLHNLNYQLDHVSRGTPVSYAHTMFQAWVEGWNAQALITLKWFLSFLFIATILLLTLLLDRVLFRPPGARHLVALAFGLIAGLAVLLHIASAWAPPLRHVSLKLLHLLQYPVPLFLLWAAAHLAPPHKRR